MYRRVSLVSKDVCFVMSRFCWCSSCFVLLTLFFGTAYDWTKKSLDGTRWRLHFFAFGHCGALVPSLAANGLVVMAPSCVNSLEPLHPSAEEPWEEMTKIEPRNKMLYSPASDQWPGRPVILVADFCSAVDGDVFVVVSSTQVNMNPFSGM